MIELHHGQPPQELSDYHKMHPNALPDDFDGQAFDIARSASKVALHRDQEKLCVYCERKLTANEGQIDHIKSRKKYPDLCFCYTNFAHSCINRKTCGQKKKNGDLPITPAPGCNSEWFLSTDGFIEPIERLIRQRRHQVKQTLDMLGLNKDSSLVAERRECLKSALDILQQMPDALPDFLRDAPFRHMLKTVFGS